MNYIIKGIKFILVSVLAVLYWPLNFLFMKVKDRYLAWKEEDRISFIIATPLYYFLFIIVAIVSYPLEILGDGLKPQIGTFR
jgi:hypothetical protein